MLLSIPVVLIFTAMGPNTERKSEPAPVYLFLASEPLIDIQRNRAEAILDRLTPSFQEIYGDEERADSSTASVNRNRTSELKGSPHSPPPASGSHSTAPVLLGPGGQ